MSMNRFFSLTVVLLLLSSMVKAADIEDIRRALEHSSVTQVQEKVYIHTDNECYFVGDTLWYKAYVVRADDLVPTDMSRILYVELLSPDGLLVERQNVIVSGNGYTCGQFVLEDSLYGGYYELRAYTRWMLNFNVSHQRYSTHDTWHFFNKQMAADFFRTWEGLYSRVLPVYSKPEQAGDYDVRRIYQRPKTRLPKRKKEALSISFYPEGGHLVKGVENRVAFEAVDQNGEAVNIHGSIDVEGHPVELATDYMGRGTFLVTPRDKRLAAHVTFRGKDYRFDLPKAEEQGMAIRLDHAEVVIHAARLPQDNQYGLSVLCRGKLRYFAAIDGMGKVVLPLDSLPTGVNDLTIFDQQGRIWADRLFFVNHQEYRQSLIPSPLLATQTYSPYERVEVPVRLPDVSEPTVFSLSIHDRATDEPSYDDGNLMTSMLLSSELRGFIARPAYYFEKDDEQHRRHLDLLMMVQGWRKYKWQELADTSHVLRYQPEKTMTVEGGVYKMVDVREVEPDELSSWQHGTVELSRSQDDDGEGGITETVEYGNIGDANTHVGVNHSGLKHEVMVEAEIGVDGQFAGSVQKTRHGRFLFEIPPFYGAGYLNLKAYHPKDSLKKRMESRQDAKIYDEKAYPDYYVKRDLPYPHFTDRYSFYQDHAPEQLMTLADTLSEFSMERDVHQLHNVDVKGHRRGKRARDWTKPAYVMNAYQLYNEMTDCGLSFGMVDMRQFPVQVCRYLYGNMNRYRSFHVDGRLDGHTYYRNYDPFSKTADEAERASLLEIPRTSQDLYRQLRLSRLQDIRVFSDYEPRNPDSTMVEEMYAADATVEMVPIPDDGRQVVYRDRHIFFLGFNEPAQFYQPDYGHRAVGDRPADYRRTLYWNPNAVTDAEGRFTATFYNNGKETRLKMTAAGITRDGRLLYTR